MRVAIVTTRHASGEVGGAERFYDALATAFRAIGHEACEIPVDADESDFDRIKRNYLASYDLDLGGYDVVVSTKAPTWLVRHPRHVCYLVHTIRVFYDMFDETFPHPTEELHAQRALVHALDTGALRSPRCRAVFTIGSEVSRRLSEFNGIDAEVMHPPLWTDDFYCEEAQDYFLLPGRLHPWKRVDLLVKAMRHTRGSTRLLIVGTGEALPALQALADGDPRIHFLGRVDDEHLKGLYARALAVPFTPKREDYGYITLEAFASCKPVLTCRDSGEAAALVRDGVNGFVCDPDPRAIAERLDWFADNRDRAAAMGCAGAEWLSTLSWPRIAQRLIDVAMDPT